MHTIMFEKFLDTGKNLANIGLHTVNNVMKHSLNPSTLPDEQKTQGEKKVEANSVFAMKSNLLRQAELKGKNFLSSRWQKPRRESSGWFPALRFTAVGSGLTYNLRTLQQPAVLFISHKENAEIAAQWNSKLLGLFYPNELPIFTANIILLDEISFFAHGVVRHELRKAYDTIIAQWLKDPTVAARWIHIFPDWDAETVTALHLVQHRPILAAVVLSPQGRMEALIDSPEPLGDIKAVLSTWVRI